MLQCNQPFLLLWSPDLWPAIRVSLKVGNLNVDPTKVQFFQGLFKLFSNLFNRTRSPNPLLSVFWVHMQQLSKSSLQFTAHYICRRQRASNASISQKVISKQRPQVQLRQSIESSWDTFVIKVSFEIETFAGCHHAHKYQEDNQKNK